MFVQIDTQNLKVTLQLQNWKIDACVTQVNLLKATEREYLAQRQYVNSGRSRSDRLIV